MDSFDLIASNKSENFSKEKNANKETKLIKFIIISLFLLFIWNLCTSIIISKLNKMLSSLNTNYGLSRISKNKQKQIIEIDNNSNNKRLNEFFNKNSNIMKEYIQRQKEFCEYPDKFFNQKYEELIKLTNFSFKNISYQMYVYKNLDRWMSNEIIRTAKYEPVHMSNFLDILK